MRYVKTLVPVLLLVVATTASAAPRRDDGFAPGSFIQRVVKFIKHIVVPTDDEKIGVPIP